MEQADKVSIERTKYGDIIIDGPVVSVKVDSARNLYWRRNKEEKKFSLIDKKIPERFTREEKTVWMLRFRDRLQARLAGERIEDEPQHSPSISIETTEEGKDNERI